MGELRDTMEEDLILRGLRRGTRRNYLRCVRQFAAYYHRSPADMGGKEIRDFLFHLIAERKLKASSIGVYIGALKFLYEVTLQRPGEVALLVRPKCVQRLPDVLSCEEVEHLLGAVRLIKHRAIIMVAYGAGLRAAEVCRLQVTDIDSQRMLIHVRDGKGGKDRYALLSEGMLRVLREYYRSEQPLPPFLFPGYKPGCPMEPNSFARMVRRAASRCGLKKRVSPHVLRHSFATELLEDGYDLVTIQQLLGHSSIKTSARYVHVTTRQFNRVVSPAEKIRLAQTQPND